MQGKALAALVTAAVLALAGCGGDEETSGTATSGGEAQAPPALEEVRQRAEQIQKERRREGSREGGSDAAGSQAPGSKGPDRAQAPAANPPAEHRDSGGGTAQFQRKGGDNSIQEFGQEGGGSELASAATVLHAYLDARAAGRWRDACSYLASEAAAALKQFASANGGEGQLEGCPDVLQALSSGAGTAGLRAAAQADVGSLRLQGDRGFLLYHGAQGVDFAMPVVLEGGEWKLAAPDATPLP